MRTLFPGTREGRGKKERGLTVAEPEKGRGEKETGGVTFGH